MTQMVPDEKLEALSNEWHSSGYTQKWDDFLFGKLMVSYSELLAVQDDNAELLRLLERHHAASIKEDCFLSADAPQYYGSELYLKTAAAIVEAKKDAHGLSDPLRMRVPVWRCPACKMKFYSRSEYDAHRAEESAGKEKV